MAATPNGHPTDDPHPPPVPSSPSISWPLNRPQHRTPWDPSSPSFTPAKGHAHSAAPPPAYPPPAPTTTTTFPPSTSTPSSNTLISPDGRHPLSGISLRAFLLGLTLGLSTSLTLSLLLLSPSSSSSSSSFPFSPLWRAPFFLSSLSLFHFLEFYLTALSNSPLATPSAFLLTSNGIAYNIAHTLALLETVFSHWPASPLGRFYATYFPGLASPVMVCVGLGMMGVGQVTRSMAMREAGRNFNHTVQIRRQRGHELVTRGVYGVLRHPSYFGFWWWGLGGQVVLGNPVCFVGYAVVLWGFFRRRIEREEELLVKFFGDDYVKYRERTRVGIPFIH